MTDRGVMFSGPMVRALLAGRKTQTRRLATSPLRRCAVGDRLWVRETHYRTDDGDYERAIPAADDAAVAAHLAALDRLPSDFPAHTLATHRKLCPSIHMPRWASRLTLIVEDVKVGQLGYMSEADAIDEGVYCEREKGWSITGDDWSASPKIAFHRLWNALHTKPGERWEDNPSIVALTFRVIASNIDAIGVEA